ncbi:hypothetical protein H0O03_02090 [Candidatus Micrarchaeota archaeon]|nr:hypothetical protein [Candidatus Micrarchaeota archaeon]
MLKSRETSFSPKQLESGRKIVERAVRAVEKQKLSVDELAHAAENDGKKKKLAAEVRKAAGCTPKQAQFIVENFPSFKSAVRQPVVLPIFLDSPKSDRFYSPKPHRYK